MEATKTVDITRYVRELIVTGQVAPGEFLRLGPLADRLGTSVTPVREALMQLSAEGFVELRPRRGFEVLSLTDADLSDVYRAQALLAGELSARATRALSPRDLDGLAQIQAELEAAARSGDLDAVERHNHAFHRAINKAAGAPRLCTLLQLTTHYAPRQFFARVEGWAQASATEHRAVLTALRAVDPEAAREAMAAHTTSAGRLLIQHRG